MTRSSAIQIDYQCPQCGAPVVIEETDRFFSCGFCRVKIYFNPGSFFHYCLPAAKSVASTDVFHLPYWRFRGMFFSILGTELQGDLLDATYSATNYGFMPPNLGYRTQTQKLRIAGGRGRGWHSATLTPETVSGLARNRIDVAAALTQTEAPTWKCFVGDVMSLIFAPVHVKNGVLYDAITDRPLGRFTPELEKDFDASAKDLDWSASFVPTLCPTCGWDLSGSRDSMVLLCRNCESAWRLSDSGFTQVPFAVLPGMADIYLPFWRMRVRFEGLVLKTYAEFARLANLPKAIQPAWEKQPLHLWVPAFRITSSQFMRIGKQMTVLQPEGDWRATLPKDNLHPVTLGLDEAVRGVTVILAASAMAKKIVYPLLPEIRATLEDAQLILAPFTQKGSELSLPGTLFTIQKNAFRGLVS